MGDGETDLAYARISSRTGLQGVTALADFYEQLPVVPAELDGRDGSLGSRRQFAALETRMEDLHTVLDTTGSSSTVLLASHESCSMAALYAATYPERTRVLVLFHPIAYERDRHSEYWRARLAELRARWGPQQLSDEILEDTSPSLSSNPTELEWFANWLRVGASPAAAYALHRA